MHNKNHIYSFNYDTNESELCKLESRHIFNIDETNKLLFSNIKVEPSSSAFIKKRFDILSSSEDYFTLINEIKEQNIRIEGFKVEYVVLDGDTTEYAVRLKKLRDVGNSIEGFPDYYSPTIIYALCYYLGIWYFGVLIKNNFTWHKHKKKPYSLQLYCKCISLRYKRYEQNV